VPEPRRRARPGAGTVLVRYLPFLAVVAGVAVIAAVAPGVSTSTSSAPAATGPLPLTFSQARARGVKVNWGPNCDTTTGRVAVPLTYAPPCVPPWRGGSNGGRTAPGVTATTITVALYQSQPDILQQTFFQQSNSEASNEAELQTTQQYVKFFEAHYDTYGRTIRLVPVRASGAPDDDVAAKADAIKVATQIHAFASFGGPDETSAYADELAARGVLCLGDCVIAEPDSFLQTHAPYIWPTLASPEQASLHWAAFVSTIAGHDAVDAGDPALHHQVRRFGIVRYDDATGSFQQSYERFAGLMKQAHVKIAVDESYQLDLTQAQEDARTIIAALKHAKVTSVLLAGDPIFPAFLTKEATAQDYFPEWVVLGYAYTDTALFGRNYDQRQWSHAFGVSLLPARTTDDANEFASILRWQFGKGPTASTYQELVQAPLIFFTGIHLAGPHLTASSFRAGLFSYPAHRPTAPTVVHMSWGRHGIWPTTDYTWGDDATVIWWDPNATGPDEVGNQGKGLYRYALGGRRYLPGQWPKQLSQLGLFDVARSVTVYRALPPGGQPPSYPSPASAPGG
jgi:hypothetical protein